MYYYTIKIVLSFVDARSIYVIGIIASGARELNRQARELAGH